MKGSLRAWPLLQDPAMREVLTALGGDIGVTRIVGGAVRDALLDRPVTDADLATAMLPEIVIACAERAGLKTAPTGLSHGTVTVIAHGRPFEVTTLRRDVETDGRHAIVHFTTKWEEDAARRDFTMNALYCDAKGNVYDPLGGMGDLKAGRVRFIGSAEDRIREDYLRILRFFRFFAHYGSGRPDGEGLKACARLKSGIATLSAERVWAELKRLFSAPDPTRAMLWMRTTEVLHKALPESWGIDAIHRLVAAEQAEGWRPDALLRLEAVLPPHRARIDGLGARLKLSRAEAGRLLAWADAPEIDPATPEEELAKRLYRGEPSGIVDRLRHALARERDAGHAEAASRLRQLIRFAAGWQRPVFPVSGRDLVVAGLLPGPDVGRRLKELEERWIDSGFSLSREALLPGAAPPPSLPHP